MKFSGQKLQRLGKAFSASGRLAPAAYANSQGSLGNRFLVTMGFTATFQPLKVLESKSFNSSSWSCSFRNTAFGGA